LETVRTNRTVDVKSNNIFVKNGMLKLSDLCNSVPPTVPTNNGSQFIGAEIFCAPEMPLGVPWTTKADIWAANALVGNCIRVVTVNEFQSLTWGVTLFTELYIFLPKNAARPGDH
jgi:hypothetical protein